jgi:Cellulase (glycosyl hydrolase family 5)
MFLRSLAVRLVLVAAVLAVQAGAASAAGRWSEAQAADWYARQGFLVGANYVPATAINQLEMWQADSFDPKRIDLELGWAAAIGMNTMRVFLHDLAYQRDPEGFLRRVDQFLAIAQRHRIRPMLVLFDSVWDPFPAVGPQRPPRPGVHNSGWVQGPGKVALEDPAHWPRLETYVKAVVSRFKDDARVLAWDLWNEVDNTNDPAYASLEPKNKAELVNALLPQVFAWARESAPTQPLTSGLWRGGDWSRLSELSAIDRVQLALSDVITFHSYDPPAQLEARIRQLQVYKRPLICTEYMARGNGSTFQGSLPLLKQHNVGAINWGLVQGKAQTHLPWDSWRRPYVDREPAVWFHEVFRNDGTPYDASETALIRSLTTATAR